MLPAKNAKFTVVVFQMGEETLGGKLYQLQFLAISIFQLLLYCAFANELTYQVTLAQTASLIYLDCES